jgi:hypothetical protein
VVAKAFNDFLGAVCGVIVHHDDLFGKQGLIYKGLQRTFKVCFFIMCRYDDIENHLDRSAYIK